MITSRLCQVVNAHHYTTCTPIAVPIQWKDKMKADLDRDGVLGILEDLDKNEPFTWCHQMESCWKHNSTPRITVDQKALNEVHMRHCHSTAPPLQKAMDVPHNTNKDKSTLDLEWLPFHQDQEEGQDMTTFLTPCEKYRYKNSPRGTWPMGTIGLRNIILNSNKFYFGGRCCGLFI